MLGLKGVARVCRGVDRRAAVARVRRFRRYMFGGLRRSRDCVAVVDSLDVGYRDWNRVITVEMKYLFDREVGWETERDEKMVKW